MRIPPSTLRPTSPMRRVAFRPYDGVPGRRVRVSADYEHHAEWFRNFLYTKEQERGLDSIEDLAAPGIFRWDLSQGEATLTIALARRAGSGCRADSRDERARRARFPFAPGARGDAYIVRSAAGKTIIAGYPWFTDWGRDTFISMRGLCLATGRLADARAILLDWSRRTFPKACCPTASRTAARRPSTTPSMRRCGTSSPCMSFSTRTDDLRRERDSSLVSVNAILAGYSKGTRYRHPLR